MAVILVSKDGVRFTVEEASASLSNFVNLAIETDPKAASRGILIKNVSGHILEMVIDYCNVHTANAENVVQLEEFDESLVDVEEGILLELLAAARDMEVETLIDLVVDHANQTKAAIPVISYLDA